MVYRNAVATNARGNEIVKQRLICSPISWTRAIVYSRDKTIPGVKEMAKMRRRFVGVCVFVWVFFNPITRICHGAFGIV